MLFSEDIKKIFIQLAAVAGIGVIIALFIGLAPTRELERLRRESNPAILERVGEERFPEILAEAVLVRRLNTGETIFAKDELKIFPVASLVKTMTAFLFARHTPSLKNIVFSKEIAVYLEPDEKRSSVTVGEELKAEDVLKLLIAESDNDAAYAAAEAVALRIRPDLITASFQERIAEFVFLMNEQGRSIGMLRTHFTNPAGRDGLLNFSTANDLFLIAKEIYMKAPEIWNTSRVIDGNVYSSKGVMYRFENTNKLLKEFPAIYGSKTGFTDEAGEALLMLYELAPKDTIAVIILKSTDRFSDGRAILSWLDKNYRIVKR